MPSRRPGRPAARARRRGLALLPLGLVLVAGLLTSFPIGGSPLPWPPAQVPPATPAPGGPGGAAALAPQLFPETGFRLGPAAGAAADPFGEYFAARGGADTFGAPVSRPFTLQGVRVQVFQRAVMQQLPTGVGLLNLLDEDALPYTDFGTTAVPPADPAVAAAAPPPGTPDYGAAAAAYVAQTVPDVWQGQPVGFLAAFLQTGRLAGAPAPAPAMQALVALEVLGFPTSAPAADPRNPLVVSQRFQRGVLQYDGATGLTQPLPVADSFKALLAGQGLPPGLAAQARGSRFALQYRPGSPGWLARPADLPGTDLTQAFEPDAGGPAVPIGQPGAPPPQQGVVPAAPVATATLPPTPSPAPAAARPPAPAGATGALPAGTPGTPAGGAAAATPTRNQETPVLERVEPGGAAVGQDVLLRGRHFGDQAGQVLFTGKLATAQLWSDELIAVTVPQGAADGTVRVRRPDGVLSNAVGFSPAMTPTPGTTPSPTLSPSPSFTPTPSPTPVRPSVTGIEPHFGGVGSSFLIRGTGFGATTGSVLLGSQTAPVRLWSDTSVLVDVPAGADAQPQRTMRVRVLRADGAVAEAAPGAPPLCFVVSPGTPTPTPAPGASPTAGPAPTATPVPPPPTGC